MLIAWLQKKAQKGSKILLPKDTKVTEKCKNNIW